MTGLADYGFALLHKVPVEPGQVAAVGDRLGHVRVTNYGQLFDVVSLPNPNNLAFTAVGLGVHTDNPYRDPTPGLQLLHCLEAGAPGGDTLLVDGFRAAEELRRRYPEDFRHPDAAAAALSLRRRQGGSARRHADDLHRFRGQCHRGAFQQPLHGRPRFAGGADRCPGIAPIGASLRSCASRRASFASGFRPAI